MEKIIPKEKESLALKYIVKRAKKFFVFYDKPNKDFWKDAETLELKHYMGQKPQHFPKTQANLLYDNEFVYVNFHVEDRFFRAIRTDYNSSVCLDSCVEFFFTPCDDISTGYFNIEMNCIGTMLFNHQLNRDGKKIAISIDDAKQIELYSSLNDVINTEIKEPVKWRVEYRVPISILEKYAPVTKPQPGVIWRANFYKCADETSHPHWLTWAPVEMPKPDFHRPEFFGIIEFL